MVVKKVGNVVMYRLDGSREIMSESVFFFFQAEDGIRDTEL